MHQPYLHHHSQQRDQYWKEGFRWLFLLNLHHHPQQRVEHRNSCFLWLYLETSNQPWTTQTNCLYFTEYQQLLDFNTSRRVFGCFANSLYICNVFLPQGIYGAFFLPHRERCWQGFLTGYDRWQIPAPVLRNGKSWRKATNDVNGLPVMTCGRGTTKELLNP